MTKNNDVKLVIKTSLIEILEDIHSEGEADDQWWHKEAKKRLLYYYKLAKKGRITLE